MPFYDFLQVTIDTKPGVTLGVGLELARARGLGVHARWHGVLGGFPTTLRTANYLSVGVGVWTGTAHRNP